MKISICTERKFWKHILVSAFCYKNSSPSWEFNFRRKTSGMSLKSEERECEDVKSVAIVRAPTYFARAVVRWRDLSQKYYHHLKLEKVCLIWQMTRKTSFFCSGVWITFLNSWRRSSSISAKPPLLYSSSYLSIYPSIYLSICFYTSSGPKWSQQSRRSCSKMCPLAPVTPPAMATATIGPVRITRHHTNERILSPHLWIHEYLTASFVHRCTMCRVLEKVWQAFPFKLHFSVV